MNHSGGASRKLSLIFFQQSRIKIFEIRVVRIRICIIEQIDMILKNYLLYIEVTYQEYITKKYDSLKN